MLWAGLERRLCRKTEAGIFSDFLDEETDDLICVDYADHAPLRIDDGK